MKFNLMNEGTVAGIYLSPDSEDIKGLVHVAGIFAGDVELVKTEYGWHIMYYVSTNDPIWKQNTAAALQNQDYEDLASAASEGWTITRGTGMNFVSA